MNFIFNSNPYALPRVLLGKAKLKFPGVTANSRTGPSGIPDKDFDEIILPGINPGAFTSWIWFYHYGI
jgi:hypothetical protein